ncbi:MAG TPA: CocE/NonD family hydrolase [Puia sp.]|jgi:putative CocE/NonD family hydrolase|nr:CocE/NonD family hydrolase [Puia sp.]
MKRRFPVIIFFFFVSVSGMSQRFADSAFIADNFIKMEKMIPMRDGVKLFTSIYIPKDQNEKHPFLMERTPYSCSPYGEKLRIRGLGPNSGLLHEKYIFVYQDVRGRYKSEGDFDEMTPAKDIKKSKKDVDESSDTFDTIEWLLKNIKNNNGRVGIYGISYPGFYASASLPDAHPAIKAVSPQAPVTDEFIGDDAYHNGAFFLMDNFDFTNYFQGTRIDSGKNYKEVFEVNYTDAYKFYLGLGSIKHTNDAQYFNSKAKIWNEYLQHDTYDDYWKNRNIRTHLKNIKPAVLVVGGWFDAEDMFGALHTYEAIEKQTPNNKNFLVMGPWTHGGWASPEWKHFGTHDFGSDLNQYFNDEIETKFFNYYLKDKGENNLSEATVFETGSNQWKHYDMWPPANSELKKLYLSENGKLTEIPNSQNFDGYVSDPQKPVPYTNGIFSYRNNEYLTEDQRFAADRPDVLVYQTDTLKQDITVTGRLKADIFFSTTGTDADIIIKVIDVLPTTGDAPSYNPKGQQMSNFQRLVRADVFRCKFRNSYEKPEALVPGQIAEVKFDLNEIAHTFKKGHRIMVQVQSSWFPIVDRNPQKFIDIPTCSDADFQKASIRLYHNSSIALPIVK